MRQLTIEPEFRDKIPPLSEDELSKLEGNILADGEVREPLVVWHNTIIDGHHRWRIIQKHPEIPYKVKQMDFPDKWAAIVWMCRNQLGRRNLTSIQKDILMGDAYKAQKMTQGTNNQYVQAKSENHQNDDFQEFRNTAAKIANDFHVGEMSVLRAEHLLDSLNAADAVDAGFKNAVRNGTISAPKSIIAEIRNIPEEQRPAAVEAIKRGDTDIAKEIIRASAPKPEKSPEPELPPFTAEELGELIDAAAKNLDFALKQHLVLVHRDVLDTERGRRVAKKSLACVNQVTQKYLEMIRRIEESAK